MSGMRLAVVFLASGFLALGAPACGGYGDDNPTGPGGSSGSPLTVTFRNSSGSAIHMFVGGESPNDGNLVPGVGRRPGPSRRPTANPSTWK